MDGNRVTIESVMAGLYLSMSYVSNMSYTMVVRMPDNLLDVSNGILINGCGDEDIDITGGGLKQNYKSACTCTYGYILYMCMYILKMNYGNNILRRFF